VTPQRCSHETHRHLAPFLLQWAITALSLSLWVASHLFKGIRFSNAGTYVGTEGVVRISARKLVAIDCSGYCQDLKMI
jgi:hypothetical protein